LEKSINVGENPVLLAALCVRRAFSESRSLELERKVGGKFHLMLNIGLRLTANKYHEGKMKRTLERELKVSEIAEREANGTSCLGEIAVCTVHGVSHLESHLAFLSGDNAKPAVADLFVCDGAWRDSAGDT
jgi:hypothetical protein